MGGKGERDHAPASANVMLGSSAIMALSMAAQPTWVSHAPESNLPSATYLPRCS
jgi:hypothetical protein